MLATLRQMVLDMERINVQIEDRIRQMEREIADTVEILRVAKERDASETPWRLIRPVVTSVTADTCGVS
jgi:hypothetical protein